MPGVLQRGASLLPGGPERRRSTAIWGEISPGLSGSVHQSARLRQVNSRNTTSLRAGKRSTVMSMSVSQLSMSWIDPCVGLDWLGLGRDFSVFGGLDWVHYSKSRPTKILK